MFKNFTKIQKITIISFIIVPILSSFISTLHIVDFFGLGNYKWMAIFLAVAFEIGALSSALSITVLDKIKKWVVYFIFSVLLFFQIIGNVYFSFNYISEMLVSDPNSIKNAREFFGYFWEMSDTDFKVYLSFLIGVPIPAISLAFLKSLIDYLSKTMEELKEKDQIVEEKMPEEDTVEIPKAEDFPKSEDVLEDVVTENENLDYRNLYFTNGDSLEVEEDNKKDKFQKFIDGIKNDPNKMEEFERMIRNSYGKDISDI